jgi:hypothetical protein
MDNEKFKNRVLAAQPKEGLQMTALAWRLQMEQFLNILDSREPQDFPNTATLCFKRFLENPNEALKLLYAFFGIQIEQSDFEQLVLKGILSKHSKHATRVYDTSEKLSEDNSIIEENLEELQEALSWIKIECPTINGSLFKKFDLLQRAF